MAIKCNCGKIYHDSCASRKGECPRCGDIFDIEVSKGEDRDNEDIDGDPSRTLTIVDSTGFLSEDGVSWHGIGNPDARACYYFAEFVFEIWGDFDPQYEWRDFDQPVTWADLEGENVLVHERPRLLL